MGQLSEQTPGVDRMSSEVPRRGVAVIKTRERAEVLVAGDFLIDLDQRRVKVRNQEVHLTADEFELLVFLLSHPKKVITAQTILSTHWDGKRVHQTRFMQVLLSLQKKLDAASAGVHYIRTEPLVVYRFDPQG